MDRISSRFLAGVLVTFVCLWSACRGEGEAAASPQPSDRSSATSPGAATGGDVAQDGDTAVGLDSAESLLAFAFEAASQLPDLHEKTRCRLQEDVVRACLEAGHASLAGTLVDGISNWRRGVALAAIALHHAERGDAAAAEAPLAAAIGWAERVGASENEQKWRWDRIRAGIAATLLELGRPEDLGPFERELESSELTPLVVARAEQLDAADLDARIDVLAEAIAAGDFEVTRSAFAAAATLYGRFYGRTEQRDRIEELLRSTVQKAPPDVGLAVFSELALKAVEYEDNIKALELIAAARAFADSRKWLLKHELPMRARLAEVRWRAGDRAAALADAAAARELWADGGSAVVDIWRAGALRVLAGTYAAMGDEAAAADLYRDAVEQSVVNPNSVPRVEDLVGNVISMVLNGHTPDASLRARLVRIRGALGDPW